MGNTAAQTLTDEQWEPIEKTLMEKTTHEWCAELFAIICKQISSAELPSPLDKILWGVRWAYIAGYRESLECAVATMAE